MTDKMLTVEEIERHKTRFEFEAVHTQSAVINEQMRECVALCDELLAYRRAVEGEKPVAWAREWDGDVSDLGNMLIVFDEHERDEPFTRWTPLFTKPPSHAQGVAEHEPHELFCPHCNPCRHREKLNEYDAVLRALCSFLSAGGYNVTHAGLIEAKSADEKIRWGIDHVLEVERKRAKDQGVAQGLEMAAEVCDERAHNWRSGMHKDTGKSHEASACEAAIRSLIEGKQA